MSRAAVTSLVHPRASIPYPQARSCYCGWKWVSSVASGGTQSSFSNLFVTSPTSQLILQHFRRFTYVAAHSPILPWLHLRHSSFFNPSFSSPTSQALHLNHLTSRSSMTMHFQQLCRKLFFSVSAVTTQLSYVTPLLNHSLLDVSLYFISLCIFWHRYLHIGGGYSLGAVESTKMAVGRKSYREGFTVQLTV